MSALTNQSPALLLSVEYSPRLHLVDVATGKSRAVPSDADSILGFTTCRRLGDVIVVSSNGVASIAPPDFGILLQLRGQFGLVPARADGVLWMHVRHSIVVLLRPDGSAVREVRLPVGSMVRADVERGLLCEDADGTIRLVGIDGAEHDPEAWTGVMVVDASPTAVLGVPRDAPQRLVLWDVNGHERGAVELPDGLRWPRTVWSLDEFSPERARCLATPLPSDPNQRRGQSVVADLVAGTVQFIGRPDQALFSMCWGADAETFYVAAPDGIHTGSVADPTLRLLTPVVAAPLIEIPDPSTFVAPQDALRAAGRQFGRPAGIEDLCHEPRLGRYAKAVWKHALPSARLHARYGQPSIRGSSRLGGVPSLPPGTAWPRGSSGRPMAFIAQVDLAEVRAHGRKIGLPSAGLLSFWVDNDEAAMVAAGPEGLILHSPGPTEPAEPPDDLPPRGRFAAHDVDLAFEQTASAFDLYERIDAAIEREQLDDEDFEVANAALPGGWAPHHRLGGHPEWHQGEPVPPGQMLIAQFDNDSAVGYSWRRGRLLFTAPAKEAKAGRFDRAVVTNPSL